MPTRAGLLVLPIVLLTASSAAALQSRAGTAPCRGAQMSGRFALVPGSAGAGNVTYALVLRNRSKTACVLSGLPVVSLRGRRGKPLPTHVRAAFPAALTAVLVRLAPGRSTRATARFSPDVPGPGEGTTGRCERTAYRLVVQMSGGGTVVVPIAPPTSVCEHGSLQFSAYRSIRS